jgi:hypothetical protein
MKDKELIILCYVITIIILKLHDLNAFTYYFILFCFWIIIYYAKNTRQRLLQRKMKT